MTEFNRRMDDLNRYVQVNNLVSTKEQRQQQAANSAGHAAETARKRRREKADINYHNYYIKISKFTSLISLF